MVYTQRAEMAAVSCGTSHASAVSTPLRWIFHKTRYKAIHSCRITCEHSEPARERRIALYKSDQQQLTSLCFVFSVRTAFNPFTAAACEISGLKDAGTCLQTVCFPVLLHLLLILCVLTKVLPHAGAKKKTERLKGFKFRTFTRRFQVTSCQ